MLAVQMAKDKGGILELNWMWLPTFIGQNYAVMRELEKVWAERYKGISFTPETEEQTLRQIHDFTIQWLSDRFKIPGLKSYLEALESIGQP
jgi:hypothetical protein